MDTFLPYFNKYLWFSTNGHISAIFLYPAVYNPSYKQCTRPSTLTATTSAKYLASITSMETGCGLTESPWVLEAQTGQSINISLTSFQYEVTNNMSQGCGIKYGYIFDLKTEQIVNLCSGYQKHSLVYQTSGHQVQILLDKEVVKEYSFIIKYQGKLK